MKNILIALTITTSLSSTLNSARADPLTPAVHTNTQANAQQPEYNCLTREVWSPKKQAWCNKLKTMNERLANTEWQLEDLGGTGVVDRVQTTLRFDGLTRIIGQGGCNRYFAPLQNAGVDEIDASDLSFKVGAIGSTRKACSPAVMDQEARYFQALARSQRLRLDGSCLLVYSDGSNPPLRFTQIPVPILSPIR